MSNNDLAESEQHTENNLAPANYTSAVVADTGIVSMIDYFSSFVNKWFVRYSLKSRTTD